MSDSVVDTEAVYRKQLELGMSEQYAQAYASKYLEGEVFARHFAILREKRYLSKLAAAAEKAGMTESQPASPLKSQPVAAEISVPQCEASNADSTNPDADGVASLPETPKSSGGGIKRTNPQRQTFTSTERSTPDMDTRKRTPSDFVIMKKIGLGSYSTVHLCKEKGGTNETYAMKILEKDFIKKEGKDKYVMIEKEVFSTLTFSPFIVKLAYTFQDPRKLYFVLEYAPNGELLHWIKKLGSFDEDCTRFYAAEILLALEHMHSINIIHRDLKPENILLSTNMHIKICDFGTAKILSPDGKDSGKADSFVGTAQYVSPELLNDKLACRESDLWALGCIIYQLLAGGFPFRGGNEYQTFKKISALDYDMPTAFPEKGKAIVQNLLVLDPNERIGSEKRGGIPIMKEDPFWEGLPAPWEQLHLSEPPQLDAYLPAMDDTEEGVHGRDIVDVDIDELLAEAYAQSRTNTVSITKRKQEEKEQMLAEQEKNSPWHGFCNPNELILKTGLVDKRRGMSAKRRQLVLTDTPRLFYIDPVSLAVMGEIPWSKDIKVQYRNPKLFFVHTPDRTYYLEDVDRAAITWVDSIQKVLLL
eukprot:m.132367 g.132367  ORF g.132367 m.132367 type:complete len:588 (+) comp17497_c0_seq1:199-1962(+)